MVRLRKEREEEEPSLRSSSEVFAILSAVSLKPISSIFFIRDSPRVRVESANSLSFYIRKSSPAEDVMNGSLALENLGGRCGLAPPALRLSASNWFI